MSYSVEIDSFDRNAWEKEAQLFSDYSIYQTWPYQENRCNMSGQRISRAIVRDGDGQVSLMCQIRIKNVRFLGLRIGYVQRGPLFIKKNKSEFCIKEAIEELKVAYLGSRVDILRFVPNVCNDEEGIQLSELLKSSGFEYVDSVQPYHTFVVKCDDDEENIRKRLRKSFRRDLKKAEKIGVEVKQGTGDDYFDIMKQLYNESLKRKGFSGVDFDQFIGCQNSLNQNEKMKVIIAYHEDNIVSALLLSNLGDSGIVLLAASNEIGLECGSSYVVWYQAIVSVMKDGMKWCDLGGINPENNASVYRFKSRLGGQDVSHIGCFEVYSNAWKKIIWQTTEKIYRSLKCQNKK